MRPGTGRDLDQEKQPALGNRIWRVIGLWQLRVHHDYFGTVTKSGRRLWSVLLKPIIIPIMVFSEYGLGIIREMC